MNEELNTKVEALISGSARTAQTMGWDKADSFIIKAAVRNGYAVKGYSDVIDGMRFLASLDISYSEVLNIAS